MNTWLYLSISVVFNIFLSALFTTWIVEHRDKQAKAVQENIRLQADNEHMKQDIKRLNELVAFYKQLNGVQ